MADASGRQRIAIVGCGDVGSALGKTLVKAGHHVVGTTTAPTRVDELRRLGIEPAVVKTADLEDLHALLLDRDVVLLSVGAGRKRRDYREVYLEGAGNLLRAAKGAAVTRIVFTSSTRVYGQNDGSWVNESSPTQPRDENGRILLEAERTLLDGARGLGSETPVSVTVVRLGGIYGPGRGLVERVRSRAGQRLDKGEACINLVHRDDVVAALSRLLETRHHGVLNLCDDHPQTRRELYDQVLSVAGLPPIEWVPGPDPKCRGKRVRNNVIKEALGLTLRHPSLCLR